MNESGDIWGLVWEEQADFGGCPSVVVKAPGHPINQPRKRKGGGVGGEKWEAYAFKRVKWLGRALLWIPADEGLGDGRGNPG